jgi:citrate lyase subunit beta / citryl-CoA lyase
VRIKRSKYLNNWVMESRTATAGNSGPKVRSECEITLTLKNKGGIEIDLTSKVKSLYGDSIIELCKEVLHFFKIRNATLKVNDYGALPFVIAARIEAAIKKTTASDLEFLPDMLLQNNYSTAADRRRFSRLYIPGNSPSLMINAGLHSSDGIILDLEDSVAPEKKDEARLLVRNALRQIDFFGAERMVRINQGETGLKELKIILSYNVNLILIPKCETAEHVKSIDIEIKQITKALKIHKPLYLMPIIESALGVENAYAIATSAENVVALAIGLEDYTSDLGVSRTIEGKESFYARTRLVVTAKAARIQPIDSVFSDVGDMEGLKQNVLNSKALGFEGMGCIHPRQVAVINDGFAPDESEIERSKRIVLAFEEAGEKGLGVVALGSKMIDPPVVARAQKCIDLAVKLHKLPAGWKNDTVVEK